MRLSRTDLVPVLAIVAGGAVGLATSASLLSSRSNDVTVVVPTAVVPDGQRISYWSSDGRVEYRLDTRGSHADRPEARMPRVGVGVGIVGVIVEAVDGTELDLLQRYDRVRRRSLRRV